MKNLHILINTLKFLTPYKNIFFVFIGIVGFTAIGILFVNQGNQNTKAPNSNNTISINHNPKDYSSDNSEVTSENDSEGEDFDPNIPATTIPSKTPITTSKPGTSALTPKPTDLKSTITVTPTQTITGTRTPIPTAIVSSTQTPTPTQIITSTPTPSPTTAPTLTPTQVPQVSCSSLCMNYDINGTYVMTMSQMSPEHTYNFQSVTYRYSYSNGDLNVSSYNPLRITSIYQWRNQFITVNWRECNSENLGCNNSCSFEYILPFELIYNPNIDHWYKPYFPSYHGVACPNTSQTYELKHRYAPSIYP